MISDEKMNHVINLMMKTLGREGFVEFVDEGRALREAKKVGILYIAQMNSIAEAARQRITSQKNAPPEHSPQWSTLYQKYYEEELKKKGG